MWSDGGVLGGGDARAGDPRSAAAALRDVAARIAGEAAAELRRLPSPTTGAVGVSAKTTPTDLVTAADTAVEALLRRRLGQLRPGDAVVGEEGGGDAGAGAAGRIVWVLDPIDGTVNYVHGLPWYAVSVAAVRDGVPVAAAVAEPVSGRLWTAAAGAGATCDGRPLRVSGAADVRLALVGTGFTYAAERRARQARLVAGLLPLVGDVRRAGSAALDVCAVAAGWLDGYLEHGTHWWDWAAAALVAAEAGAVVRVPGPPGSVAPDDGLGDGAVFVAAPGIATELADLARACGAAGV